ncbi:hypothetical protein [Persicobacter diffluens]|uniref:Uncharacterized protein n=1 Tax=Persicobacter diffluens TaxID=981 RepID=A0AAN4W0G6_9BACT|nr:hypothetical protein PEDI_31810 [Persicobacter diffluens]
MKNTELVFNIWFIVDIRTGLSSAALFKAYRLSGSDDDKFKVLQEAAAADYPSAQRIDFDKDTFANIGEAEKMNGMIPDNLINSYFYQNMDLFLKNMEQEGEKFPKEPLFISTFLMQNEVGEIRPMTSEANKEWALAEQKRLKKA